MKVDSEKYIIELIEKIEFLIGEGYQSSSVSTNNLKPNIFQKTIVTNESTDLSFLNGLVSTGLRASAFIPGEQITSNYNQIVTAFRQHLPWVCHTNARVCGSENFSVLNNYESIFAIKETGCFQFVATSPQKHIWLSLIAHRIAELSLIPGFVISDYEHNVNELELPQDELVRKYLASPDDIIECPTPAQEMIFGKTRRRIPSWFNFNLPVSLGAEKNDRAISFERAANQKYFIDHLPQLIEQATQEFKDIFGIEFKPIETHAKSSKYAIVSAGSQISDVFDLLPQQKTNVESISIQQLSPFPAYALARQLKGKKSISIFENIGNAGSASHSPFYYQVLDTLKKASLKCYSVKYAADISVEDFELAIQHMLTGQKKLEYILGLNYTKASSKYPKHEILLQQIQRHYPDIGEVCKSVNKAGEDNPLKTFHDLPMAIRRYKDKGPNFTKLSRFYVDTAFFYTHDEQQELVADPFTAVPVVPGASASFFNHSIKRNQLPVFNPRNCTGCGDCFVHCPHSALPPIVIGFEQLLKTAANIATSKGKLILKFSPVIKNLAKLAGKFIKEKDVENAQDILIPAFENLSTQMKWDGEKLEILRTEFNAILDEIGAMPMAITDTFYKLPRLISKDNGELFSLAINPSACTGCSICAQVCEEEALSMQTKDEKRESEIKHQFAIWEKLPDTSGETINRLYHDKDYSSLSALFLSRNYYMTMTGASNSELHNPYKILLHVITATAEAVVQPKIISQLKSLDKLIHDLSEQIHKKLSSALPKDNFEELSKSLRKANGEINTVEEMVQDMSAAGHDHYIDSVDLSRKVDLVEDLKKIKWTLTEGPTGVGRSRYGFLLGGAQSMDWAREFPANHFSNPLVIHWSGSAPQQSLGLFYGHLRHTIEYVKKMRQAVLEIKDGYDPETNFKEISALDWDQLTIEEKKYIPPILLIAERSDLNQGGWNDLNKLLAGNYPIKVILMDHMASSVKSSLAEINQTFSGLLSVMSTKNAFVFQGGMGDSEHLFSGLMDGMDKPFPALFNLYATKMDKHNNANLSWSLYASLVLNSRAFPSLRYDPSINGSFLSGAIELEGNRNKFKDWVEEELNVGNDDTISYKVSWADWAFTQKQWREKFEAIELKNDVILLTDFLQLDQRARKSVIPAILRGVAEGVKYYTVSPEVVEISETVLSNWNTIQELAGLRTEFPLKLKEEVEKKLQSRYLKAEAELKRKYDEQLKNQEAAQAEIMRQKLKDKLLSLSLMANRKVKS